MTEEKTPRVKKRILIPILIILVASAVYLGIVHASKWESTEDAYVETHTVQVAPKVSGQIIKMYVTDNQHVNAGDLVAKKDSTLLKQKNAKANFEAATSEINLAKKNLDRYTELFKTGAASKLEYDNAKTTYANAQAGLTQAQENLLSKGGSRVADADLKQLS